MRLSAFVLAILIAAPQAYAGDVFWLRGSDEQVFANGSFHNAISEARPGEFSGETTVLLDAENSAAEFYREPIGTDIRISGKTSMWISEVRGSGKLRFKMLDFDANSGKENEIATSGWVQVANGSQFEADAEGKQNYILEKSRMIKIIVEFSGRIGESAEFSLDKHEDGAESSWSAPDNQVYSAEGISGTAAILIEAYGLPQIKCRDSAECQDSNASTTDTCFFPGTYRSFCGNEYSGCKIECASAEGCTEKQGGICVKPGSCSSYCSYGGSRQEDFPQEQGNSGQTQFTVVVDKFAQEEYKKGTFVRVSASVSDKSGRKVFGARVSGETSSGISFPMKDVDIGLYEGFFQIPNQMKPGAMQVRVTAARDGYEASGDGSFRVVNPKIRVEIATQKLQPVGSDKIMYVAGGSPDQFEIGEKIRFSVKAEYENTEPVVTDNIYAEIRSKPIQLRAVDKGIYEGEYSVGEKDEGKLPVKVYIDDGYNNLVEERSEITVSGVSLMHLIASNLPMILFLCVLAGGASAFAFFFMARKNKVDALKKRESEIIGEIKELQTQYFVKAQIDKATYSKKMAALEPELKKIREEIISARGTDGNNN